MIDKNYTRRNFGLIAASVIPMSLAGCMTQNKQEIEFETANEDEFYEKSPEEWEKTENYNEKEIESGDIKVDVIEDNNNLYVYTSGIAPQSNYILTIDTIKSSTSTIIVEGFIESTESDLGLTVLTEVDNVIKIDDDYEDISTIIFNLKDSSSEEYTIETSI